MKNDRLHQLHHHSSIDDPSLLRQYQDLALRGGGKGVRPPGDSPVS
jgi:hypothetical protein